MMHLPLRAMQKLYRGSGSLLAVALTLLALALLFATTQWEHEHDTPLLNYAGYLMARQNMLPYRDIFETSMPGALFFHYLLALIGAVRDPLFFLIGDLLLLATATAGVLILRPLGARAALLFAPLYICVTLLDGPGSFMQRDWVAVLPLAIAVMMVAQGSPQRVLVRQALIGFWFGLAALVKPQLAVGAAIAVLADVAMIHARSGAGARPVLRTTFIAIGVSLAGFALPLAAVAGWLVTTGIWDDFWFVLHDYLPLHIQQTGTHVFLPPDARGAYLFGNWLNLGGYYGSFQPLRLAVLIPIMLGLFYARHLATPQRVLLLMLAAMAVLYGTVPVLAGQFWHYHYYPFAFFAALLICTTFSIWEGARYGAALGLVSVAVTLIGLAAFSAPKLDLRLDQQAKRGAVAAYADVITRWLPAGGRVQPIDWTQGVIHALLRTRTPIATPFLYDYHFYHHVGSDQNRVLRDRFMAALTADPPEMMLEAPNRPRVSGVGTSDAFPAFDRFVQQHYALVEETAIYRAYLRRDLAP